MSSKPVLRMPVLFVGHGNPMNAIEQNEFHRGWENVGRQLPRPKAIVCISAHWETRGVSIMASEKPETIHDFYGFPPALFAVQYPAPGDVPLARRTADLLAQAKPHLDLEWGLDHGTWSVLIAMYPKADIPVIQLSLDTRQPASFHYDLAQKLAPLRDEGVLILGSGNLVHNLRLFDFGDPTPPDWASRCDEVIQKRIIARDHKALIAYETLTPEARLAVPTTEHYLPLLYALALQNEGESFRFFNQKVVSSISMTSILIGET
jgi:4,5-DOPA dioxygenase extradiol